MTRFNPKPPHRPTEKDRRVVKLMAGYGIRQDAIARGLGIGEKTLRKHYREELDIGLILATARVAEALYRIALDDNHPGSTTAAIFWLKCRAGWREPPREHAGKRAVSIRRREG
jgi:hypothetical protein